MIPFSELLLQIPQPYAKQTPTYSQVRTKKTHHSFATKIIQLYSLHSYASKFATQMLSSFNKKKKQRENAKGYGNERTLRQLNRSHLQHTNEWNEKCIFLECKKTRETLSKWRNKKFLVVQKKVENSRCVMKFFTIFLFTYFIPFNALPFYISSHFSFSSSSSPPAVNALPLHLL